MEAKRKSGTECRIDQVKDIKEDDLDPNREYHHVHDTKNPRSSPFKQQKLPAFYPKFTADKILPVFFIVGLICLILGIASLYETNQITEVYNKDYTNCESMEHPRESCANVIGITQRGNNTRNCTCELIFQITEEFKAQTLYIFYKLTNFHQNHRRYLESLDYVQLQGRTASTNDLKYCEPFAREDTGEKKTYWPCGAVANSKFQDEITLTFNKNGHLVKLKGHEIARSEDKEIFHNPKDWQSQKFKDKHTGPKSWKKNPWDSTVNGVENEDLMIWMRPAPFSDFRKLYRIVDEKLEPGDYTFTISYSYSVIGFGGSKSIILTTLSKLTSSRNRFVGICFIILGSIAFIFGILCLIYRIFVDGLFPDPDIVR